MSEETPIISAGVRAYISSVDEFGVVNRPSFLGLTNAPVIQMDDGTLIGLCGNEALEKVVRADTRMNLLDTLVEVPLDVRITGIAVLNAMGVSAETQALMFTNFRAKLTKEQRTVYANLWLQQATATQEERLAFVQNLIATLTAL